MPTVAEQFEIVMIVMRVDTHAGHHSVAAVAADGSLQDGSGLLATTGVGERALTSMCLAPGSVEARN